MQEILLNFWTEFWTLYYLALICGCAVAQESQTASPCLREGSTMFQQGFVCEIGSADRPKSLMGSGGFTPRGSWTPP